MSDLYVSLFPWMVVFVLGMFFYIAWQRERRIDRDLKMHEFERQARREEQERELRTRREEEELKRADAQRDQERWERYDRERQLKEDQLKAQAGVGSGGFIVLDLPEGQRPLFHDLLKGFEEYARLKGYGVAFSVDNTFSDRIAFKFTLTDPDVVVGQERIRKDLKEYLERVSKGDPLDDVPQVISLDEHNVLVATLRNRISFLQHSYALAKTSAEFYESIMRRVSNQPFLPSPSVVVQTGGSLHAPVYSATNSPQALLGHQNSASNSIRIGNTYIERKEQLDGLAFLLGKMSAEAAGNEKEEAIRNLANVKEELESAEPEPGRVARWLRRAKEIIELGSFGHQTVEAAKALFKLFGMG